MSAVSDHLRTTYRASQCKRHYIRFPFEDENFASLIKQTAQQEFRWVMSWRQTTDCEMFTHGQKCIATRWAEVLSSILELSTGCVCLYLENSDRDLVSHPAHLMLPDASGPTAGAFC